MILRLSQKLNSKIKAGELQTLPLDKNPFADWSAHLFVVNRIQYILLSNTKSLYSMVLMGKGITNDNLFVEQALNGLREFMVADGLDFVYDKLIAPQTGKVQFAKALNRSVTGSMTELIKMVEDTLTDGDVSPFRMGFQLNDTLLSGIASSKAEGYAKPDEVFRAMVKSVERASP